MLLLLSSVSVLQVSDALRSGVADLWEFNLRDIFRWCELVTRHKQQPTHKTHTTLEVRDISEDKLAQTEEGEKEEEENYSWDPGCFVELIFSSRLRDAKSREKVCVCVCV